MNTRYSLLISILLSFFLVTILATPNPHGQTTVITVNIDGTIRENEYDNFLIIQSRTFYLYWTVDLTSDFIYFGIIGGTNGWVAIGIDPTDFMDQADM